MPLRRGGYPCLPRQQPAPRLAPKAGRLLARPESLGPNSLPGCYSITRVMPKSSVSGTATPGLPIPGIALRALELAERMRAV